MFQINLCLQACFSKSRMFYLCKHVFCNISETSNDFAAVLSDSHADHSSNLLLQCFGSFSSTKTWHQDSVKLPQFHLLKLLKINHVYGISITRTIARKRKEQLPSVGLKEKMNEDNLSGR